MNRARRYVAFAPGAFASRAAKTAHGVIAYAAEETVADVGASLAFGPTALLIGIAPPGGALPASYRAEIVAALHAGLEIVSGLHVFLNEDAELRALAEGRGTRIWDLRTPPQAPLFSGAANGVGATVVLTVGSDCAVGKMTVALELTRAARRAGRDAAFVPTGQTGMAIAAWGTAIDRVIADFAAGAAEQLVLEGARRARDLLVVEGQGGINHPAYGAVTLALLYGCAPDTLVLVHRPSRTTIEGYDVPLLGYRELIRGYESLCAGVKPAPVVALALSTFDLDEAAAERAIAEARAQTGLPCDDVVRHGPQALYAALEPRLVKAAVRRGA